MKKYKSLTKIIATFMAFIIAFIAMPTQAIALHIDESEISEENIAVENNVEVEQAEVFIVEEDTSKRGQFEKHYLCSDGTYVSVTYPEAVHYLDSNQMWQDVDQSLTYDSKTGTYKSEKADFKVSFSDTFSTTNVAQIERNGYSLSWGIQTSKKATVEKTELASSKPNIMEIESTDTVITPSFDAQAQVISTPAVEFDNFSDRLISREDSFALPDISSQISYSDVLNGSESVSVRYTVYHNKIEEDIIISDRGDIRSVSMNMDIGTLTPIVNADGSVDLVDANNVMQFRIGIPYMMDADFSVCNDISVTAEKVGSNCIITYTPDLEWFSSEDRAFPIVLDPAVTTNDYVSNIQDTYVEQNSTANHTSEQYLQIYPNGTNRRKAVVRITKLPVIDESMPIISARLTLTSQFASFSNVNLKAGFYYSSADLDEYTYGLTTAALLEYTVYSSLNAGTTTVAFDVSSYIYEMYADEQLHDECGYNNVYGDFIIGYASDTDTTNLYPFFSSEYTNPTCRPVFTVRYGYTLPAGILNGGIYSFRNYASYSYMSVNGTNPANNSNIYQLKNDSNVALTTQKFKLEYVSATGGYLLRSLSSSSGTDKVVSIDRNGGEISGGQNVRLSSPSDSMAQEWLIIPVDYDMFKIVPRANMNYALTAYWYSDGTNTGTGALSVGNIFIQTYGSSGDLQHWYVYDNSDNELNTLEFRSEIESGYYYISNSSTGKYLHRSTNVANCMRGTIEGVGEKTVRWKIVNLGDGYCTIQRSDLPNYYLIPTNSSDGSGVRIYNSASETIPDNCKWSIRTASGGGLLIQNKATGYYLSAISSTNNPSSVYMYSLKTSGTAAYQRQIWRIAHEDDYFELGSGASFNDLTIDVGETKAASINKKPNSAYWSTYRDFDYTITSGSEYVSYNASTHKFTGIAPGTATVTGTHKTTGLSDTFTIKVNNNAIIIIPGIMGTELMAGINNNDYPYETDLWSESFLDGSLSDSEIANRIISLRCDSNGESVNDVVPYNNKYGANDTYKPLFTHLEKQYGLEYTIEFFAYDWRLSNATSAASLNTFINTKGYDKVVLVCHSMGGLVASGYLSLGEIQRNKVETVITLGAPLLGTSVIPYLWGSEDIEVTGLLDSIGLQDWKKDLLRFVSLYYNVFDMFLGNFKSLYELFPSEKYFDSDYAGKSYLVTSIVGNSDLEITTYSETKERLGSYLAFYKSNHINSAETFHSSLYSGSTHVTELVNTYYIAGYNLSTIDIIEYDMWDWSVYNNTMYGDSLVATWSATLGDRTADKTFYAKNIDHVELVSNTEIKQFIEQLIDGNTSVTTYSNIYTSIQ